MMEISYRRELEHNYLILEQENYEENYQTEMITKNKIPGLLECRLSRLNQRASLCYEITSKQNLRLVLERKRLSEYELRSLLEGIRTAGAFLRRISSGASFSDSGSGVSVS